MSILRASIICACWCTLFASLAACQSTPRRGTSRPDAPRTARQGIRKVVYVCGERTACPRRVTKLQRIWRRAGVSCLTLVMPGAGHEYGTDFDEIANQVFDFIGGDEG